MSVDQTNVIDAIGVDIQTGAVFLTISDQIEWTGNDNEHLMQLQDKLNTYLRFVESGEILQVYPDAKGRAVVIDVVCKYLLSEPALNFFSQVSTIVNGAGIKLQYRQIGSSAAPTSSDGI